MARSRFNTDAASQNLRLRGRNCSERLTVGIVEYLNFGIVNTDHSASLAGTSIG